jgi:predicted methyltransferase
MRKNISLFLPFAVGLALCSCGAKPTAVANAGGGANASKISAADPVSAAKDDVFLVAARAIVDSPDRSADDKALDAGRKPAETLGFIGLEPAMRVAEMGAGGGYTSELLARTVGPSGKVYGQNSKELLAFFAEKPWTARVAKPVNSNITRLDTPFDAPFPDGFADNGKLDAVVNILFYHDTVWMKTDRDKMNKAIFAALKSGGVYIIVDHAANEADGITVTEKLHRISEQFVIDEIKRAGFVFDKSNDFLRNSTDTRDWNASPSDAGARRGTSDRFALRFRKP